MSEAVDTRVVEAKFDSAQFEKGVDRTVKKLDELKKSLDLEESGKSIAQLASKTQEATEKASGALEKLENRITTFTGMLKNKLLSGIADEVVGAVFKMKNAFEGLVKSLSTGQISVGISKYEQSLTSVRTMIAAGDTEEAAYAAIDTLGKYADQTSYSLDQMTSALSKMRAAGVNLDDGTKAVEGISNACAAAGINATDASRAFFNLSQAYSSGYLKYTDYRSLELLNMTTEQFKIQMLEAAEAAGTLKKVSDGVYQTINKNDKKVTAGKKVTTKNLTDALKYNIINTEAMNKLFGEKYFFDEEKWEELKKEFKALGKTEEDALAEAKLRYGEVAVNAYFAAREARSFTDVMSTLKDVVSRGWARSFELIFGKLEEATKFFTWLTENDLAKAIYSVGEFRNLVLEAWQGNEFEGGRNDLIEALKTLDGLLGRLLGRFIIFNDEDETFEARASEIGSSLSEMTMHFREAVEKLDAWFTDDRVSTIREFFSIIGKTAGIAFKTLGIGISFVHKLLVAFSPVIDAVGKNINKILDRINVALESQGLSSLRTGLDNVITVVTPLAAEDGPLVKFIDILGEIGAFFAEMAVGSFTSTIQFFSDTLGFLIELFGGTSAQKAEDGVGILGGMKNSIMELGNTCKEALQFVADFFHNLYEDILVLLGIHEVKEGEEGGFFTNLKKFIDGNEFIASVKKWIKDIPKNLKKLWNTIDEWLFGKKIKVKDVGADGKTSFVTVRLKSGFSKMLDDLFKSIKEFITVDIPKKAKEIWNSIIEAIFGKSTQSTTAPNTEVRGSDDMVKSGFQTWFEKAVQKVKDWIADIPEHIKELWNKIIDLIFYRDPEPDEVNPETNEAYGPTDRVKNGFLVWLESVPQNIINWIKDDAIPWVKKTWNKIINFIFGEPAEPNAIDPDTGKEYGPNKRVKSQFVSWLQKIGDKVAGWFGYDDYSTFVTAIWDKVMKFIFGGERDPEPGEIDPKTGKEYEPNVKVKTGFLAWLGNIPANIKNWFEESELKEKLQAIWDKVLGFIFYEEMNTTATESDTRGGDPENIPGTKTVHNRFKEWIEYISTKVSEWVGEWKNFIEGLWNTVLDAIFGKTEQSTTAPDTDHREAKNPILTTVGEFVENLGLDIGKLLSKLPEHIINGWNSSVNIFKNVVDHITKWLGELNAQEAMEQSAEQLAEGAASGIEDAEESGFISSVVKLGKNLLEVITKTIPKFLTEAFTAIGNHSKQLWEAVQEIFNLNKEGNWVTVIQEKASNIGTEIGNVIRGIPDTIRSAVESVKRLLGIGQESFDQYIYDEILRVRGPQEARNYAKQFENRFNLWEIIKEAFGAGKDAVIDLGPDIIHIFDVIAQKLSEGLTWVTNFLNGRDKNEDLSESLTKAIGAEEELGKGSEFGKAIAKFGESLGNLITHTIPDFISAAVDEVCVQVPKILEKLTNMFTGDDPAGLLNLETEEGSAEGVTRGPAKTEAEEEAEKLAEEAAMVEAAKEKLKKQIKELQPSMNQYNALARTDSDAASEMLAEINKYNEMYNAIDQYTGNMDGLRALSTEIGLGTDIVEESESFFGELWDMVKVAGSSKSTAIVVALLAIGKIIESITDTVTITDEVEAAAKLAKWEAIKIAIAGIVGILAWTFTLASLDDGTKFERVKSVLDSLVDVIKTLASAAENISGIYFGSKTVNNLLDVVGKGIDLKADGLGKTIGEAAEGMTEVDDEGSSAISDITSLIKKWGGLQLTTLGIESIADTLGQGVAGFFDGLSEAMGLISTAVEVFMGSIGPVISTLIDLHDKLPKAIESIVNIREMIITFYSVITETYEGLDIASDPDLRHTETTTQEQRNEVAEKIITGQLDEALKYVGIYLDVANQLAKLLNEFQKVDDPWLTIAQINSMFKLEDNGFKELIENLKTTLVGLITATTEGFPDEWEAEEAASYFSYFGSFLNMFATSLSSFDKDSMEACKLAFESISSFLTTLSENDSVGLTKEAGPIARLIVKDIDLGRLGRLIAIFGSNLKSFFNSMEGIRQIVGTGNKDETDLTDSFFTIVRLVNIATSGMASVIKTINSSENIWEFFTNLMGSNDDNFGKFIQSYAEGASAFFLAFHKLRTDEGVSFAKEDLEFFDSTVTIFKKLVEAIDVLGGIGNDWTGDLAAGFGTLQTKMHNLFNYTLMGIPTYRSLKDRVDDAAADVKGTSEESVHEYKGFLGYLKQFMIELNAIGDGMIEINGSVHLVNFRYITSTLETIVSITEALNKITNVAENFDQLDSSLGKYINLMDTFVTNKKSFTDFFEMTKEFNSVGLDNASKFADTLYHISSALEMFSDYKNEVNGVYDEEPGKVNRVYNYSKGLQNLLEMDWESLKIVIRNITDVFTDKTVIDNMETYGKNIVNGLTRGISDATINASKAMENLAKEISGTFTVQMEINSPSKLFERFGEYLDMGLANGIGGNGSDSIASAETLAENIINVFRNTWGVHSPSEVAKKLAMYFDEGLNDGLLKYGALPVGAAEDTADSILDVMFRALENNDTPEDVKGYAQTIVDALTDFDEKDIDKGYWMYLENMERYNRAVEKEAEKAKENSSSFWDVMTYLFEAPKDPTKPRLLDGFLGDIFGAGLTSNVELTEEDQEAVKNAIKLLKGEVNEVASEAVKEEAGNNIFTSMSIWDWMMFRTKKYFEYDENSGLAKAGKFGMAIADWVSKIKQNLIPNLSGVVDEEGIWNTIVHMYTDKSGEMQKLTSALLSDMTQIGDKYPELSGVAAALGEVFKQLDKSDGGWDVLGQVLDAAAKEFTDNEAVQYVNKIFGQLRSAAEGKEGSELGFSITEILLGSANEFLNEKFGDSPIVETVKTYAEGLPGQIQAAIDSGMTGVELGKYILSLIYGGAEDYLSEENPLAAMVVGKISELIGLSKDEDLTIEPKVKPVLEMSDDFKSGMDTINSFLGGFFNPTTWFNGENPTLNTNTSLDLASQLSPLVQKKDYSGDLSALKIEMGEMKAEMASFNRSVSSMKFVIKGDELTQVIGPSMNQYLGYEDMTRGSRYEAVTS